jgi:hypothetical protein
MVGDQPAFGGGCFGGSSVGRWLSDKAGPTCHILHCNSHLTLRNQSVPMVENMGRVDSLLQCRVEYRYCRSGVQTDERSITIVVCGLPIVKCCLISSLRYLRGVIAPA